MDGNWSTSPQWRSRDWGRQDEDVCRHWNLPTICQLEADTTLNFHLHQPAQHVLASALPIPRKTLTEIKRSGMKLLPDLQLARSQCLINWMSNQFDWNPRSNHLGVALCRPPMKLNGDVHQGWNSTSQKREKKKENGRLGFEIRLSFSKVWRLLLKLVVTELNYNSLRLTIQFHGDVLQINVKLICVFWRSFQVAWNKDHQRRACRESTPNRVAAWVDSGGQPGGNLRFMRSNIRGFTCELYPPLWFRK